MSKQNKKTQKGFNYSRGNISSDIKLFLLLLTLSTVGLSVFIFWSDIKNYITTNHNTVTPSKIIEIPIFEDDKLQENAGEQTEQESEINSKAETQDKYEKKDKEYLEKLIQKN